MTHRPTLSRRGFAALALGLVAAPALPVPTTLLAFAIAGGMFHGLRQRELRAALTPGLRLALRRESLNPYDPNAVAVLNPEGVRLGYVPRRAAGEVAARLDGGEALVAQVTGTLETLRAEEAQGLVFTGYLPGDPRLALLRLG